MFGKKNKVEEVNRVIIAQYDKMLLGLAHSANIVRGWAQAVKWYGLPLDVFIKDSAEYTAALMEMHDAQLHLHNAMGVYDADRHEFIKWVELHFDELPANYQKYKDPATSAHLVKDAIHGILQHGYIYFNSYIKKREERG